MKSLATENEKIEHINKLGTDEGTKTFIINSNKKLVDLNIALLIKFNMLKPTHSYTLDVDATNITSRAYEAKTMYRMGTGFSPLFATINNTPVATSMRSGNTPPQFGQVTFIKDTLRSLQEQSINVDRIHMDGGAYQKETMAYIYSAGKIFLISGRATDIIYSNLDKEATWIKCSYNSTQHVWDDAEFTSIPFSLSEDTNVYRLAAIRVKESDKLSRSNPTWHYNNKYYYNFLITNDLISSEKDLFYEYNKRGRAEQIFKMLKSNFGLNILPFSNLNHNHVFVLFQVIVHNIYLKFVQFVSDTEKSIKPTITLNSFKNQFMHSLVLLKDGKYDFLSKNGINYEGIINSVLEDHTDLVKKEGYL